MEKKKGLFRRLLEALRSSEDLKKGKAVIDVTKQESYYKTDSTFADQMELYEKDALIKRGTDLKVLDVVGGGYYISKDDAFKVKLNGLDAKEFIEKFSEEENLDELLIAICKDLILTGTSVVILTDKLGLTLVPIEAIQWAEKVDDTTPTYEKFNLKLTGNYGSKLLKWGEFLLFRINMDSVSQPFGRGMSSVFIETRDSSIPDLQSTRESLRRSLLNDFKRRGFFPIIASFEGMDSDDLEAIKNTFNAYSASTGYRLFEGAPIWTSSKAAVVTYTPSRSQEYTGWLESFMREYVDCIGVPILATREETLFSKGSMEKEVELYDREILGIQRQIKRGMEILFAKVLDGAGYDSKKAGIRLNWGAEKESEIKVEDIFSAVERGILTPAQGRAMLEEIGWDIPEAEEVEEEVPEVKPVE